MAPLTLRSWPFPINQEVELVWFGSPYIDYRGNWRIRVAFRTATSQLKIVSYPWGTLPHFRIGQIYLNGKCDPIKPLSGSTYKLVINNFSEGKISNGFKLPKRLIDFGKNPELGLQKVIQFQVDRYTYCIPVIELVRAMFINSQNLATYLLQPHGLDLLVDNSQVDGKRLHFDMSLRVPVKLATENNARHLSWIYMDQSIRSMWDSVYRLIFSQAIKDSPQNPNKTLRKGIPLDIALLPIGPVELYVRGDQFIDYVLVKEVIGFSGFQHPYEDILFWHPSKKHRETKHGDKHVRLTPKAKNNDYTLNDESENAKEDIHQDVLETPPTFMRFTNSPVVTTRKENIKRTNTGSEFIATSGRGGKLSGAPEEVSTEDPIFGGNTPPIDFQTLETIPSEEAIGLETFFNMIQILKQVIPVKISMSILRVPPGKRFSTCPNGARRTCAIVQITNAISTTYLVEVARPDHWSISTLILRPTSTCSKKVIEQNIKLLLEGLVQKGGHWDQYILNRCDNMVIEKVRHYQIDDARDWAYRIAGKL